MMGEWPYAEDGVQRDEFCESLRIPIITTSHPRWCYITAVVVGDDTWQPGERPTDDELRAVASFHEEYLTHWYNTGWLSRMRERPFDLDCAAVGRYLIKSPEKGWGYRRSTWERGPTFVFASKRGAAPWDLTAALDDLQMICDQPTQHWLDWKAAHPGTFDALGVA